MKKCFPFCAALLAVLLALGSCAGTPPGAPAQPPAAYADPDALLRLIREKTEPFYVVDVRSREEYGRGHIPTAINVPVDQISRKPPTPNKSTLIVVYCASGARSAKAKQALEALGYARVADFGPMSRWKGSTLTGEDPGDCPCLVQ